MNTGSDNPRSCPNCLRDTFVLRTRTPSGSVWTCTHCGFEILDEDEVADGE